MVSIKREAKYGKQRGVMLSMDFVQAAGPGFNQTITTAGPVMRHHFKGEM
jgi:hypothetical protein